MHTRRAKDSLKGGALFQRRVVGGDEDNKRVAGGCHTQARPQTHSRTHTQTNTQTHAPPAQVCVGDEQLPLGCATSAIISVISIRRDGEGRVGLRFLRPHGAVAGPFEVTSLVRKGAACASGVVRAGDWFCAVNGKGVSALTDAAVAALFKGASWTDLTLSLCARPHKSEDGAKAEGVVVLQEQESRGVERGTEVDVSEMTELGCAASTLKCSKAMAALDESKVYDTDPDGSDHCHGLDHRLTPSHLHSHFTDYCLILTCAYTSLSRIELKLNRTLNQEALSNLLLQTTQREAEASGDTSGGHTDLLGDDMLGDMLGGLLEVVCV